ncbi:7960_t:CDS:2 [Paraglomus brasilianum]|uniref:7960_t:CDS:1 n=1 Tax=Paraglomus brasilianum TaxID=144538 RepID=A0A9N9F367_9GLOM|nr:7960_t:CDS:2 [Paraglomus brasilianum]
MLSNTLFIRFISRPPSRSPPCSRSPPYSAHWSSSHHSYRGRSFERSYRSQHSRPEYEQLSTSRAHYAIIAAVRMKGITTPYHHSILR